MASIHSRLKIVFTSYLMHQFRTRNIVYSVNATLTAEADIRLETVFGDQQKYGTSRQHTDALHTDPGIVTRMRIDDAQIHHLCEPSPLLRPCQFQCRSRLCITFAYVHSRGLSSTFAYHLLQSLLNSIYGCRPAALSIEP
jgi:hypothetical protein